MDERERFLEEMEDIKRRLAALERSVSSLNQVMQQQTISKGAAPGASYPSARTSPSLTPSPDSTKKMKDTLFKDGLEMLIGKNLLNRVGIIVLLFAVGYFLKYSFDNGWIGELGRVAIGFLAGLSFLVAGDINMRRGYKYFSQGLSGGGIAIIYLSTFAAVNYYQLISAYTAFSLLIITTLAGGLLARRQDALGLAILAALGGFLAPFLIGSQGRIDLLTLLLYICILDLGVLYLAYYKNWRSLNILAFLGTALAYTVNSTMYAVQNGPSVWTNQSFLTIYFVIFGALAFFYNVRYHKPTTFSDLFILTLNGGFFFGASYANLNYYYGEWMGILAVALTLLYLSVALALQRKEWGDRLLFLSLLGMGLVFLTIAIPLQFNEHWVTAAWLVEALVLIFMGYKAGNKMVLISGLGLLLLTTPNSVSAPYFADPPIPLFNHHSLDAILGIGGYILAAYIFYPPSGSRIRPVLRWGTIMIAIILTLSHLSWEVNNLLQYFRLDYSAGFAVSLSWVILAVILILWGMLKDLEIIRYISLALFAVTTLKIMFIDLNYMPMVYRIIILTVVGAVLVGVSFAYQKKEKKEAEL
ncbi:hypothetical protein ASZ90_019554 [hydrocarbon metagenome]|uniref:DUF2339 domain-containing protein n=1 Tax=hydrocarbon metagenome TaxID=938273 RepID=A0A0W8E3V9_9ZZZZ